MDEVVLERELKSGHERTIMTTWHHGVPLEEAVDFALRHATPDDALSQGCEAVVLAAVGDAGWTQARGTASRERSSNNALGRTVIRDWSARRAR
jgi:hypothetical protein